MPKKRTTNASTSKASQPRAGPDYTWTTELETLTSADQLKQEHLERAIGLTSSRRCSNRLALEIAERNRVDEIEDDDDGELDKSDDDENQLALTGPIIIDSDEEGPDPGSSQLSKPLDNLRKRPRPRPNQRVYGKAANQKKNKKSKSNQSSSGVGNEEAYVCTVAGCRENLRCLNYTRGKVWLDPKSKKKFMYLQGLGPDPALEARDPLLPVGLRNLGATCYANAFLQVWYRILPFRSAVYACAMDPAMPSTSPCYQLALTFTGLQNSVKGVFDPSGLVDALRLEKGDQQDASEFSKLFMALLQTEFSKNDDPKVKSVINDQFEGQLKYKTECLTCGYISERPESFLELEISMEGTESNLINRLAQSLTPETLDGDNRYYCSRCDKLCDAERSHQIETVPPTLNFSLLRFVFDPNTYERRKSKSTIAFPPRINMRPYMSDPMDEDLWYELKGVIEHRGPSAHHGHFVARVYVSESQQWVLCDDETTTRIRAMTALPNDLEVELKRDISDDDMIVLADTEGEDRRKAGSKPSTDGEMSSKPTSRASRSQSVEKAIIHRKQKSKAANTPVKLHKSQQAYMLVYGLAQEDNDAQSPIPIPAARTSDQIAADNLSWEADGEAYETKRENLLARFEDVKTSKLDIMSSWDLGAEEDGQFVSLRCLKDWILCGLEEPATGRTTLSRVRIESPAEHEPKPEDIDTEEKAMNGDLVVVSDSEHATSNPLGNSSHAKAGARLRSPSVGEDNIPSGPDHQNHPNSIVKPSGELDTIQNQQSTYDDPLLVRFANSDLRCKHGNLDPHKQEDTRLISKLAYDQILALGSSIDVEYNRTTICRECVWSEIERRHADRTHQDAVINFHATKNREQIDVDEETYLVSSQWLKAWIRNDWTNTKHSYAQGWWNQCRSEIQCFHHFVKARVERKGCVVINHLAYEVMKNDDSNAVALPTSLECQQCLEHENRIQAVREAEIEQAKKERKSLHDAMERPEGSSIVLVDDWWYYIAPASFRTAWKDFVDNPIHKMRPCLSNEAFFCQHGRITLDFNYNPDLSPEYLVFLLPSHWEALTRLYPIEPDQVIRVMHKPKKKAGERNESDRDSCKPCWQLRVTGSADKIRVRVRLTKETEASLLSRTKNETNDQQEQSDDHDHEHHDIEKSAKINKAKRKLGSPEPKSASLIPGVRKSSRLKGQIGQFKEVYIDITKTSSIRDLKQTIDQALNISPYAQRLYKDGIDLNNDKGGILDSGIVFDSVVYVRDCSEDMFGAMEDVVVISDSKGDRAAGGFQNTLLHGLAVEPKSESPKETEVELMAADASQKPCNACTYLNKIDFLVCEMCDTEL